MTHQQVNWRNFLACAGDDASFENFSLRPKIIRIVFGTFRSSQRMFPRTVLILSPMCGKRRKVSPSLSRVSMPSPISSLYSAFLDGDVGPSCLLLLFSTIWRSFDRAGALETNDACREGCVAVVSAGKQTRDFCRFEVTVLSRRVQ